MTVTAASDPFVAQKALVEQLDKSGWDLIVGDAFVRGMRDIGYKSTSYALSELIDNSVQAEATWVDVIFGFEKGRAITPALATWQAAPTRASGEHLAALVDRFGEALFEHLDLEERGILPLASRHVTAAEWDQMGEHGSETMRSSELPILFGLILEDADAEERARLLVKLPLAIRVLLRTVGAWQFSRYVKRLRQN